MSLHVCPISDERIDIGEKEWEDDMQITSEIQETPLWREDSSTSLSDWKIIVDPNDGSSRDIYDIHKVYVAKGERRCRYFTSLFSLPLQTVEHERSETILQVPELCVPVFPDFLDFVYAEKLSLNKENVVPLMELARRLENIALEKKAAQWAKRHLKRHIDDCALVMLNHSIELQMEKVQRAAVNVITAYFCTFFPKVKKVIYVRGSSDTVNGRYIRFGSHDGVNKYCNEESNVFTLFRNTASSGHKSWYIAIVPVGRQVGSRKNHYFCYAPSSNRENELPPRSQWKVFEDMGDYPPPKIIRKLEISVSEGVPEFLLALPLDILLQVLDSDELNVDSEDEVYDIVSLLVRTRELEKSQKEQLWRCVRFSQLSNESVAKLATCETLSTDIYAKDLIMRICNSGEPISLTPALFNDDTKRFQPRTSILKKPF